MAADEAKINRKPFIWTFGTTVDAKGKVVPDTYEIDVNRMDVLGLAALGRGDTMTGVRRLFTAEQYARLEASDERFTNETLAELLDGFAKHLTGLTLGESKASSRSSNSTPRRSRSTSAGTGKPATRKSARKRSPGTT